MSAARVWFLVFFLALLPLAVLAQPPFQTSDSVGTQLSVIFPKLETYKVGVNSTLHFHVFDTKGLPLSNGTVSCYFHLYDTTDNHILSQKMVFDVTEWEILVNSTLLSSVGEYPFTTFCYNSTIGGYVSGSFFVATDGETEPTSFSFVLLAFLPFFFGFLVVMGARLFDPVEHWVLHVGAYLLSLVSTFVSSWFGVLAVIKFSEWGEMQEAMATWTWVSGLIVGVFVIYWFIYIFYKLVQVAAQKKERRLEP